MVLPVVKECTPVTTEEMLNDELRAYLEVCPIIR